MPTRSVGAGEAPEGGREHEEQSQSALARKRRIFGENIFFRIKAGEFSLIMKREPHENP